MILFLSFLFHFFFLCILTWISYNLVGFRYCFFRCVFVCSNWLWFRFFFFVSLFIFVYARVNMFLYGLFLLLLLLLLVAVKMMMMVIIIIYFFSYSDYWKNMCFRSVQNEAFYLAFRCLRIFTKTLISGKIIASFCKLSVLLFFFFFSEALLSVMVEKF